jgi:hypothetical protein
MVSTWKGTESDEKFILFPEFAGRVAVGCDGDIADESLLTNAIAIPVEGDQVRSQAIHEDLNRGICSGEYFGLMDGEVTPVPNGQDAMGKVCGIDCGIENKWLIGWADFRPLIG